MDKKKILELYQSVVKEFNNSTFALSNNYHVHFSRTHIHEFNIISELLGKDGVLLDIGTGSGIIPRMFNKRGHTVISVDFPKTGGMDSLERIVAYGVKGYYCQVGDEPIPIPAESADVVFVGNVIEHLPHSPKGFMKDILRVLKKGGYCVMDTKNAVDLKTRIKMMLGISNWPSLEGVYELEYNIYHHKEYTLKELKRLFELSGFHELRVFSFESFFFQSLKKLNSLTSMGVPQDQRSKFGTGFNPLHPYEYLRLLLLFVVTLFPNTRSDIMVVGKKSNG